MDLPGGKQVVVHPPFPLAQDLHDRLSPQGPDALLANDHDAVSIRGQQVGQSRQHPGANDHGIPGLRSRAQTGLELQD